MGYRDWLKCASNFEKKSLNCVCPHCGASALKYQFVGDKKAKFGGLYLWCDECKHGIHISSVLLPDGVDVLPFDMSEVEFKRKIPDYKLINK